VASSTCARRGAELGAQAAPAPPCYGRGLEPRRSNPTGRFTLLVSPTLFALLFSLAMALCKRQDRQMDVRVIHPALATRLSKVFGAAAQTSSFTAGAVALGLALLRFRSVEDGIAAYINTFTFMLGLAFRVMVA
jgi:hypothetical protein